MGLGRHRLAGSTLALVLTACGDPDAEAGRFLAETLSVPEASASPPTGPMRRDLMPAPPASLPPQTKPDREKLREWQERASVVFPKGMRIRINAHYRDLGGRHRIAFEAADCPIGPPAEPDEKCPWAGLRMALPSEPNHQQIGSTIRSCLSLATLKLERPKEIALRIVFEAAEGRVMDPLDPDFGYNVIGGDQHSFLCVVE